jgi:hypothetical protein
MAKNRLSPGALASLPARWFDSVRVAAKVRKLASKLTPEEEAEHFRRGMAKIYGGQPKEITGAGH